MLRSEEFSSKDLWEYSKAKVRKIESEDAVLIFDDSIEKKPSVCFELVRKTETCIDKETALSCNDIITIYKKRWKVEEFHKSLKQNASLEKSPTKTARTQSNHFFASMCAYVKLEILRCRKNLNHFALKARLYYNCLKSSFHYFHKINDVSA